MINQVSVYRQPPVLS
ncbi:hypothetical protein [Escherichia coli]|nr:hypothetical protein [Escherichia coli]